MGKINLALIAMMAIVNNEIFTLLVLTVIGTMLVAKLVKEGVR